MKPYLYTSKHWKNFKEGNALEWVMTNGLGSYGGMSLIGSQSRTHQGYLIASLHAPTMRYLVFQKTSEQVNLGEHTYSFHTSQYRTDNQTSYAQGQLYLKEVLYDGTISYQYQTADFSYTKQIALKRNENTCALYYNLVNTSDETAVFHLTPFFNYREHNENSVPDDFSFTMTTTDHQLILRPVQNPDCKISFSFSDGILEKREKCFDENIELQIEVDLETEGLDSHFCPYDLVLKLPPHMEQTLSLLCEVSLAKDSDHSFNISSITPDSALCVINETKSYYQALIEHSGLTDDFAASLVLAADHFLCYRQSTSMKTVLAGLPWFTDWGRDTMIAFTGLTLCSKRFDEAKEILLTFSKYIQNGIVPNMFPDNNTAPLYNTADASLLYFYAVERYLHYVQTKEAYTFIYDHIFLHLKDIISAYEIGTDFSIYMDQDGLIHAGSGLDQITWMDVRVGDWVATPRHGKPVEINAYWYNALKVMEMLCLHYGEDASHYTALSARVKKSYLEKFWNPKNNCLYDVIDGDEIDVHIRPNQIYAVSMPYSMLSDDMACQVVETVARELYTGCGLRSLAANDKEYHGIYCGALPKRDAAYHQGTSWGFLLGGFFTAFRKVNHYSEESRLKMLKMIKPIQQHMYYEGCIGSISEIFDGDAPHHARGCYAQAWSIGEVLRAYTEDILQISH